MRLPLIARSAPGVHQGYEYSRTHNPTRSAYEGCIASLESGHAALPLPLEWQLSIQ